MPHQVMIFCDMDGVIADFATHAATHNKIRPDGTVDWAAIDHQWWATMPAFDGMHGFVAALRRAAPVRFLSAPSLSPDAYQGKATWIETQFNKWALRDLILCAAGDKHLLARAGYILIDDRADNIRDWQRAGGIGILHTGDYQATLRAVAAALKHLPATPAARYREGKPR